MNLYLLIDCSDAALGNILSIIKNIVNIIWIAGPILAIISLAINLTLMVKDPDDKKVPKKIKNSIIALILLFLVPAIINASMYALGDNNTFSSCWNSTYEADFKSEYEDPDPENNPKPINSDDYEPGNAEESNDSIIVDDTSCGSLEYCNKYLSSLVNNSKTLDKELRNHNRKVIYSNSKTPKSWSEAFTSVQAGNTLRISCNRPSQWSMRDITGDYVDFWSGDTGGFHNYKGKMKNYTKQLTFDGSMSVQSAIMNGTIKPGDIVGVHNHTFTVYKVNTKSGSATVFDGANTFIKKCKDNGSCSPKVDYSVSKCSKYQLYQIIRWVK